MNGMKLGMIQQLLTCPIMQVHAAMSPKSSIAIATCLPVVNYGYLYLPVVYYIIDIIHGTA